MREAIIRIDSERGFVFGDRVRNSSRHIQKYTSEIEMRLCALRAGLHRLSPKAGIVQPIEIAGVRPRRKADAHQSGRDPHHFRSYTPFRGQLPSQRLARNHKTSRESDEWQVSESLR